MSPSEAACPTGCCRHEQVIQAMHPCRAGARSFVWKHDALFFGMRVHVHVCDAWLARTDHASAAHRKTSAGSQRAPHPASVDATSAAEPARLVELLLTALPAAYDGQAVLLIMYDVTRTHIQTQRRSCRIRACRGDAVSAMAAASLVNRPLPRPSPCSRPISPERLGTYPPRHTLRRHPPSSPAPALATQVPVGLCASWSV